MDYVNDSLKAKYITLEEYDEARKINSNLKPGYFSTNEYLDYFNYLDLTDKSVLSVCSSGDQIFMSLLKNASLVDCFDSNSLQYYIFELKKAAIIGLSKDDYLNFFPLIGGNILENYNKKYYDMFKDLLPFDVRYFWDSIYENIKGHIYLLKKFSYSIHYQSNYTRWYDELKEKLKTTPINYFDSDFYNAYKYLNKKYDVIMLSNIYDHISLSDDVTPDAYINFIVNNYFPLLNENGICICHYQFLGHNNILVSNFNNTEKIKCSGAEYVHVLKKTK